MNLRKLTGAAPALPLILLGFFTMLMPVLILVGISFQGPNGLTFENYLEVFQSKKDFGSLKNSLEFATWQMVLCTVLGTPVALALTKLNGRSRANMLSMINVASSFSGAGLALAFVILLGNTGVLTAIWANMFNVDASFPSPGSMIGLNIIMLYSHLPLYLILSLPSYSLLREQWREAATMSGAGFFKYWWKVGIPVLAPFVLGNAMQTFMWAMGSYTMPYIVTGPPGSVSLLAVAIGRDLETAVFGFERAATLAVLLMVQAIALIWIYRTLQRRGERIL